MVKLTRASRSTGISERVWHRKCAKLPGNFGDSVETGTVPEFGRGSDFEGDRPASVRMISSLDNSSSSPFEYIFGGYLSFNPRNRTTNKNLFSLISNLKPVLVVLYEGDYLERWSLNIFKNVWNFIIKKIPEFRYYDNTINHQRFQIINC